MNRNKDSVAGLFGGADETAPLRPSTKLNSKFVGGRTQICLSHESDQSGIVSNPTKTNSSQVSGILNHSYDNSVNVRPSTKLNSFHVGGRSQISLAHESVQVVESPQKPVHTPFATESDAVEVVAPQHSNNKNASHFSFEHDSTPHLEKLHFGKRFSFSSANEMNNEIAKENVQVVPEVKIVEEKVAAVVKEEVVVPTKAVEVDSFTYAGHRSARTGRSNEQTFSLWDSQEVNTSQVRPSSRVLKAPGGGSSFSFS